MANYVDVLSADQFKNYVNANGTADQKKLLGTATTDWQKEILTERLEAISKNPNRVKPIQGLFDVLDKRLKK